MYYFGKFCIIFMMDKFISLGFVFIIECVCNYYWQPFVKVLSIKYTFYMVYNACELVFVPENTSFLTS